MKFDIKKYEQSYYLYSVSGTSGNVAAPVLGKCFHCRARFDGDFVSFCGFVQKIRNHQKMKNSPTDYTLFREVLELWMAPMAFSQTQRNAGCDFCGFAHKNGIH